jgi:hypothetical protein
VLNRVMLSAPAASRKAQDEEQKLPMTVLDRKK